MSDVSQGPGWWIASDGKWYPPEDHPDRRRVAEAVSVPPVSRWLRSGEQDHPESAAGPGDESAVGPGIVAADEPAVSPSGDTPAVTSAPSGEPALMTTGEGQVFDPAIHVREARSLRFWILGALVLVALAVAALIVALRSPAPTGASLSTGPTTASIVVIVPRTGHPSFSGTLAGRPLSGVITGKGESISTNGGPIAEYRGTFGNVPFDLHVSLKPFSGGQISFGVTGVYGSKPVTATARFGLGSATVRSLSVPFNGRVGAQTVRGVATATPTGGNGIQISANLSVLSLSI